MENFWDFSVWGDMHLFALLLVSLLLANLLKRSVPFLQASLIPTSVLGGGLLVLVSSVYKMFAGVNMFDTAFFAGHGTAMLEIITYHALALGFIASSLKTSEEKMSKQRSVEIFNTGVTTVGTYLLQAIVGFGITLVAAKIMTNFFPAAGVLLPFAYGQGPGQAMNYGGIYELQYGFEGGKSFGLTVAALGFIFAALGGVFHLNLLKRKRKLVIGKGEEINYDMEAVQLDNEIPMEGSMDKLTVQIAFVFVSYFVAYLLMLLLGNLVPGMRSVIYGFNFLLGVIAATLVRECLVLIQKKNKKRRYINNFLLTRLSNFFFDIMIVASIAAIRLGIVEQYWGILLVLGIAGFLCTYLYNYFVAKTLFPAYKEEQFLAMYGMLTGTASTGVALLREIDGQFKTPVAENLVYQNFPAIVFGFPMMLLATMAPEKPILTFVILITFFAVMNLILFRKQIFKRNK